MLPAQIASLRLVPNPGKPTSPWAAKFVAKYGSLFQIEVEAVDPAILEQLVTQAVSDPEVFDEARWADSKAQEDRDRVNLARRRPR